MRRLRVGCSGWQYAHWHGLFYPHDLGPDGWLEHYARVFDTVELNGTFYRLPEPRIVRAWRDRTPPGFLFAWKASRYLSHLKKLKDPRDPLGRVMSRARLLGPKLGPVLVQLPPHWEKNLDRLRGLVELLPKNRRFAFEVRDPSWYADDVYALLDRPNVALCAHDMPGSATPRDAPGAFVYVRFHGATAAYAGGYPRRTLDAWADRLAAAVAGGRDVYAYFNNDQGGHAPRDAVTLRDALHARLGRSRQVCAA